MYNVKQWKTFNWRLTLTSLRFNLLRIYCKYEFVILQYCTQTGYFDSFINKINTQVHVSSALGVLLRRVRHTKCQNKSPLLN